MQEPKQITDLIKAISQKRGLSTYKLAQMTATNQPHIVKMFSGNHPPRLNTLCELCKALNLEIEIKEKP